MTQRGSSPRPVADLARLLGPARRAVPEEGDYVGSDGLLVCGVCGTPRECRGPGGRIQPCLCEHRVAERDAVAAVDAMRRRAGTLAEREGFAFTDKASLGRTFAADDGRAPGMATCRSFAERFPCGEGGSTGLLLYGRPGQGKTFALCAIANELLRRGFRPAMRTAPWLVQRAQEAEFGDRWRAELLRADLLLIDDLGAQRSTGYADEVVHYVVNAAYSQGTPLVVSTNLDVAEMRAVRAMSERRVYDRILERCYPVAFEAGRERFSAEGVRALRREVTGDVR